MASQFDFKKEWETIKNQLIRFSKEASEVAKKGEEELVKFSHRSKLHFDSAAANLKKEGLYYLIGREYVRQKDHGRSAKLSKLLEEFRNMEKDERSLKRKLKSAKA